MYELNLKIAVYDMGVIHSQISIKMRRTKYFEQESAVYQENRLTELYLISGYGVSMFCM